MNILQASGARWVLLLAVLASVGCAQPTTSVAPDTAVNRPAGSTPAVVSERPAPRMSRPLPPSAMPQPVKLDYSCNIDSDCAVKDVGSCCGALPDCVNRNSPTNPAAVKAQCARDGATSSCGFRNLDSCGCQQHRCTPKDKAPVGGWIDDPAPPSPAVR